MKLQLTIPARAFSWNRMLNKHWQQRRIIRDEWYFLVLEALNESGFKKKKIKWKYPLILEVHAQMKGNIADTNNICDKYIVDALTHYKIIKDDNPQYIGKCIYTCEKHFQDIIIVKLYD